MAEPRQPEDHKKKVAKEEFFTFSSGGSKYTMPKKTLEVLTTKFVRQNRRRDELDFTFTCIEALAGDEDEGERIMDAFDAMDRDELNRCVKDFTRHAGATLGE
jgi:hypothetical protein